MGRPMRTNKVTTDRRKSERRVVAERRTDMDHEHRGMVASMVDALEDILEYERASERMLRAASGSN